MAHLTLLDDQASPRAETGDVLKVRLDLGVPSSGTVRLELIAIFNRIRIRSQGLLATGRDIYLASGGAQIAMNLNGFKVTQYTPSETTPVANQVHLTGSNRAEVTISPKFTIPNVATLDEVGATIGGSKAVERTATFESHEATLQSNNNVDSIEWIIEAMTLAGRRSIIASRPLFAELIPAAPPDAPTSAVGEISYSALRVAIYDDEGNELRSSFQMLYFLVTRGLASIDAQRESRKVSFKVDLHA